MEGDCILSVPEDLVIHILSQLAVRHLLRFRSVSKEWCALIDSPCFIKRHYQVQYSIRALDGNSSFIVYNCSSEKLALLSIQEGEVNTSELTDYLEHNHKAMIPWELAEKSGCANGIICLTWRIRCDQTTKFLSLWNPATREFKAVSCPDMPMADFRVVGFGFDRLSKDFKILGEHTLWKNIWPYRYYELYSLKANSWKSLTVTEPPPCVRWWSTGGYLNGVCYWESMLDQDHREHKKRLVIVSFNFCSEDFKVFDPPEDAFLLSQTGFSIQNKVTLYKESSIALLISHNDQENPDLYKFDMWVVTDFDDSGVPLSWQHLLHIGPLCTGLGVQVDTILTNGDLLLNVRCCYAHCPYVCICYCDRECWIYNASTNKVKKLGKRIFHDYYPYAESLFPLSKRRLTEDFHSQ